MGRRGWGAGAYLVWYGPVCSGELEIYIYFYASLKTTKVEVTAVSQRTYPLPLCPSVLILTALLLSVFLARCLVLIYDCYLPTVNVKLFHAGGARGQKNRAA